MKKILYLSSILLLVLMHNPITEAKPVKNIIKNNGHNREACKDSVCKHVLKKCEFVIDGQKVILKKGKSKQKAVSGSKSRLTVRYIGINATGDLNSDGIEDVALILTKETGGSGTFYYVAAALSGNNKKQGTNAILLGDRIKVSKLEIKDGKVFVHYYDRKQGQSMVDEPTVKHSIKLRIEDGNLLADQQEQSLTGKEWKWVKTVMNNGEKVYPKKVGLFSISFMENGSLYGQTDCNGFFGSFKIQDNQIQVGPLASTRKFCEDSQENIFTNSLQEIISFFINEENQLILELKFDSGSIILE